MVLGLRSKSRKVVSVQVDYIIHLREVKPWPPSQSLRSLRSVVLQWENGDRSSGSTNPVVPSIAEGRIEFNESFKIHATLTKEVSSRGSGSSAFHKNLLELHLYEPKKDKAAKGQLLASAAVDLAEHAIVKKAVTVGLSLNYKRSYRNAANSMLYVRIQPYDKEDSTTSSRGSLSNEASMDRDDGESVSALMTGEYAEESEIASFTDDDVSSSQSSPNQNYLSPGKQPADENVPKLEEKSEVLEAVFSSESSPVKPVLEPPSTSNHARANHDGSLPESLTPKSLTDPESLDNGDFVVCGIPQWASTPNVDNKVNETDVRTENDGLHQKVQESTIECTGEETDVSIENDGLLQQVQEATIDCTGEETDLSTENDELLQQVQEATIDSTGLYQKKTIDSTGEEIVAENRASKDNGISVIVEDVLQTEKLELASISKHKRGISEDEKPQDVSDEIASTHLANEMMEVKTEHIMIGNQSGEKSGESNEFESSTNHPDNHFVDSVADVVHSPVPRPHFRRNSTTRKPFSHELTTVGQRLIMENGNGILKSNGLKSMKLSVRSNMESSGSVRNLPYDQGTEDVKEIDVQEDMCGSGITYSPDRADNHENTSLCTGQVDYGSTNDSNNSDNKVRELELKVKMLESELREAAAVEVGLYCVVATHGSSANKVHTPARRLSRLYIHASKHWSLERRASAARSAVSGLFLAAKACGNDVPRLTFWLSNSVVLRAVVAQSIFGDHYSAPNGFEATTEKRTSLKWESIQKKEKFSFTEDFGDWEDPYTFMGALERIEAWIFSRIVESIWWQTFTPHMQMINEVSEPKAMGSLSKKGYGRRPSLGDQKQASSSIEIWKRAFKDACERLCPVRAGGHECGCLPMLARLIMEQCVARLDVAMFNAILRESDEDIPNNPLSDPISDSKVLPIPSGKLSFGAGAQLKNAIGNWSRWLADLFGMDEDDNSREESEQSNGGAPLMSFRLLYALSDLLMLPKDMLLERSIRKEVCPTFSASVIKRILNSFQPDEFCPDPITDAVLEALDSEDPLESSEEGILNIPCDASPVIYSAPSIDLVESIIGEVQSPSMLRRSGSSVVRKCHTSDDELEELDSPLNSVITTAQSRRNAGGNVVRYQLLREVWRDEN